MSDLPIPRVENWNRLYEPGARAKCVKDSPPMYGFGRAVKAGDVVNVHGVCWRDGRYEIAVREECAFYAIEGWFEVVVP